MKMELDGGEVPEKESDGLTVDLSKQALKKIERASIEHQNAVTLVLDNNEIPKLDNLEYYPNLTKLSAVNNQLVRMYGVSHLINLVSLDLSNNSLITIEGLKDLKNLKYLNLAKNRVRAIEHLNRNLELEKLDLSENNIMYISDVSYLTKLKEFHLHGNRISHLKQCEKFLPNNIEFLTLNNNSIADLNEISYLVHLTSLKELSIVNNPCLDFTEDQKFNYRPFVKNWCSSLIVLDNSPLNDIECLKAEWLYSQGRGRSFRSGEHSALIEYLMSVCPREGEEDSETEDVKKLKLILSKAQLHQQQLREQLMAGKFGMGETSKSSFKKKIGVPERMVTSFHDSPAKETKRGQTPELMTRSLDSGISKRSEKTKMSKTDLNQTPLQTSTTFIPIPDTLISPDIGQPIGGGYPVPPPASSRTSRSSSRTSPRSTPENKRKPVKTSSQRQSDESTSPVSVKKTGKVNTSRSSTPLRKSPSLAKNYSTRKLTSQKKGLRSEGSERNCRETSEEEDGEILPTRVKVRQKKTPERNKIDTQKVDENKMKTETTQTSQCNLQKYFGEDLKNTQAWKAAVCIQRRWRGYRARNLNGEVVAGCKDIQINRMQEYLTKVMNDMEVTRNALEGNRKLVVLQMQAINSLWKKMMVLQPLNSTESKVSLEQLVETCDALNKQVEGLQNMMKNAQKASDAVSIPIATQTDITAVHTPQGDEKEKFPYNSFIKPSENQPSIDSTEDLQQNCQDSINDSDNCSSTCTVKTVTELFNSTAKDKSNFDFTSSQCSMQKEVFSEYLSKPLASLQNAEESISEPEEVESSRKSEDSQNSLNS